MLGTDRTISWLKKTRSIALLGLERAGKTTFMHRFAKGISTKTLTTLGLDVEHFEVGNENFNIIDLGGQEPFRLKLWQTYAQMASGIIFVFDVTDRDRTQDAIKWFWQVQAWVQPGTHIMFCANKIDLKKEKGGVKEAMSLEEIINFFDLKKFAEGDIGRIKSFRIFEVSALTGENVQEAMTWLFNKLQRTQKSPSLRKIVIADIRGKIMCEIPFMDEISLGNDNRDIANILIGNKDILPFNEVVQFYESEDSIKILISKSNYLCILSASKEANFDSARIIAETIMSIFLTQIKNNNYDTIHFTKIIKENFSDKLY